MNPINTSLKSAINNPNANLSERLGNTKLIMFNAKFDIRVLRHQIGVYLTAWWDGYIAQKLLNENEEVNKLKPLHNKYVLKSKQDAFSFSDYFDDINFALVTINCGYIYAARDAEITF